MSKANPKNLPTPSPEKFVEVWRSPEVKTRKDVVNALTALGLHITMSNLYAREKSYREAGVELSDLQKGAGKGRKLDVAKLNLIGVAPAKTEEVAPAEKAVA